ncbi:helix-turn-helix domain-containing protein [Ruixingdingia sedimenti]|uniref:Helix-turn-helix transcriptional regulator n=1 Tax=Ruixingdingia sedimenti TaxID=3073604 RepID=A0ABU1FFC0_9RHOB|nr:helix-turn-helix transcriptional regulator [Xinfangfangia sp. LG-4]MDR5655243.1 helix-turn-helix transcriptional regulator [Xinfangfangia sp. LG-4]
MFPALETALDLREAVRVAARNRRIALNITQADLAVRSGVPLGTLKRFERLGEVSLSSLLAIAEALDALEGFHALFPMPEARTLDEVEHHAARPKRARSRARG